MYSLCLGKLDPNDETILVDWYGTLGYQTLNWDVNNLCGEPEITCDSLNPQRLIKLYEYLF